MTIVTSASSHRGVHGCACSSLFYAVRQVRYMALRDAGLILLLGTRLQEKMEMSRMENSVAFSVVYFLGLSMVMLITGPTWLPHRQAANPQPR